MNEYEVFLLLVAFIVLRQYFPAAAPQPDKRDSSHSSRMEEQRSQAAHNATPEKQNEEPDQNSQQKERAGAKEDKQKGTKQSLAARIGPGMALGQVAFDGGAAKAHGNEMNLKGEVVTASVAEGEGATTEMTYNKIQAEARESNSFPKETKNL
ncbi:hypothetical protein CPB86DRAFT_877681 [Serendipita vermifera]|nr:hypothetical protein CPB86DRAFT_877681 [Serendipita vermifera]